MKRDEIFSDNLYTVTEIIPDGNGSKLKINIQLNPSHEIFKGHFPGNPILPGVCIVQILKEILMRVSGSRLSLNYANSIKYISFIDPGVNGIINIDMELNQIGNDKISCNANLGFESVVFCRFKGEFMIFPE